MNKHHNIDIRCYQARGRAPFLKEHHQVLHPVEMPSTDLKGGICLLEYRGGSAPVINIKYTQLTVLNNVYHE